MSPHPLTQPAPCTTRERSTTFASSSQPSSERDHTHSPLSEFEESIQSPRKNSKKARKSDSSKPVNEAWMREVTANDVVLKSNDEFDFVVEKLDLQFGSQIFKDLLNDNKPKDPDAPAAIECFHKVALVPSQPHLTYQVDASSTGLAAFLRLLANRKQDKIPSIPDLQTIIDLSRDLQAHIVYDRAVLTLHHNYATGQSWKTFVIASNLNDLELGKVCLSKMYGDDQRKGMHLGIMSKLLVGGLSEEWLLALVRAMFKLTGVDKEGRTKWNLISLDFNPSVQ